MREIVSLSQARSAGLVHYFTGKPCKHGHVAERNVKGRHCVSCVRVSITAMRERYGEEAWGVKERARNMDYIHRNRDTKRASARKSMAKAYAADPQRFIDRSREHELKLLAENPLVVRLSQAARRAAYRVRSLGVESPRGLTAIVRRVWDRSGGVCAICAATDRLELDHKVALMNGGDNAEANFQFLCKSCNSSKGAKDFQTWLQGRSIPQEIAA